MSKSSPVDQLLIRSIAELVNEANLAEIEIEKDDLRIRVTRSWPVESAPMMPQYAAAPLAPPSAAPAPTAAPSNVVATPETNSADDLASNPGTMTSPMVGTAYLSPEPGATSFVAVGEKVSEGQTVLIIEAMKTMNQIPAHRSGTISKILIDDSQPVEYGEPLVVIE